MSDTMTAMPRKPQVRVPADLLHDIAIIAAAFGESVPHYVARTLRTAVERDRPKAKRIVNSKLGDEESEADPE